MICTICRQKRIGIAVHGDHSIFERMMSRELEVEIGSIQHPNLDILARFETGTLDNCIDSIDDNDGTVAGVRFIAEYTTKSRWRTLNEGL